MKTKDWSKLPAFPGPIRGRRRDQMGEPGDVLRRVGGGDRTVAPLPGEEALYHQFRAVLDAAAKDPEIKQTLEAAVETEREMIAPVLPVEHNGRPAGNGWNRSVNNAQWGTDYFNRTGTAKSNMFDNRPNETQYIYTDDDSAGGATQRRAQLRDHLRRGTGAAGQGFLVADPLQRCAPLQPQTT